MRKLCFLTMCVLMALVSAEAKADNLFDYLFGKPTLQSQWTYATGIFDASSAEIVAFDANTQRVFVTNSEDSAIDVLDVTDGSKISSIDVSDFGSPTSVSAFDGLIAIAVSSGETLVRGRVVFADAATLARKSDIEVGYLPDMLTFTPDGKSVVVANEAEPSDDYLSDPEGSVSIIKVRGGTNPSVVDVNFLAFNDEKEALIASGVRIFGPGASVAQDLEPEYITISADSKTAYVACQENNAIAMVDLKQRKVLSIAPLGLKNHSAPGNGIDASNRDDAINIQNWPTSGMYQPDSIASFKFLGFTFVASANEGDARDYDGYSEEARVKDLTLDPTVFPDADSLQEDENLGRLLTTTANGDIDDDGVVDEIYSYGARSFSIWRITKSSGAVQVYDSGDDFEQITADQLPAEFNSNNDENGSFDSRSDDKGPEPEALTVGSDLFQTYSLIGLERIGGIMVYEITNPFSPRFIEYTNNRNFSGDAELGTAGDLGPEGIVFVPRGKSPFVEPVVVVANEVSGSTTLYRVKRVGGILSSLLNGAD